MPDIGLLELILIGAIAFLVLGPEKMPELFSQVSKTVKTGRAWISNVRQQIEQETDVLKQPVDDVKDALSGGLSTMSDKTEKSEKDRS
ncbi:MAG: twin-arginine translocase TatA/TatE family subunit [Mariprofundaceae bacterium]